MIGAVLNSFGVGGQSQTPIGVSQPNMQFSIPMQVTQGNERNPSPSQSPAHPIPDSLKTISDFMNHMEQALSQNGHHPSDISAVELPSNARGLPSPSPLAVKIATHLEEEEGCTDDVTMRTQIQSQAMQYGLAMQHLGALLLELGPTMLTLHIGESPAESSVNAGPAVYISPSGPNPIMVQFCGQLSLYTHTCKI
ncbi:unnamed protein product [Lactuca virosa]|uniref:Uncharacterized protein n=1 Tax=Lactuca virosa TaxID=75947 RepID=A0AAU9LMW6_9ASTR|nr:unnamed protein product [Lactuca virosa]